MRTKTALAILVGSAGAALVASILGTDRTLALLSESYALSRSRVAGLVLMFSRVVSWGAWC